jgi:hypothetical protein
MQDRLVTTTTAEVRFLAGARNISLLHSVQAGYEVHPVSYTMDTGA